MPSVTDKFQFILRNLDRTSARIIVIVKLIDRKGEMRYVTYIKLAIGDSSWVLI